MASLGSLGKRRDPLDIDFDWFGHSVRVNPVASDLIEVEFLEKASAIDLDGVDLDKIGAGGEVTGEDLQAMNQVMKAGRAAQQAQVGAIRQLIHPDDWDVFWREAVANGQSLADLMDVQRALTEAITKARTGFPTGQSSGSSAGAETTPPRFEVDLPSPDVPGLDPLTLQGLQVTDGRPDLQVAVLRAGASRNGTAVSV